MINIPKGTKDVLPKDSFKWQYIEETARNTAKIFGFKEIRTPVFEHTEVFLRGVGDTTDIVNKEMYTFLDKGGRSITLKPEGTAAIARSFLENGLSSEAFPLKMYYITPCFRYERPQAGRLREFHQFGVEVYGASSPDTDAEVIALAKKFLDNVGVKDIKLYINSLGCAECRKRYNEALKEYLSNNIDNMCQECKERFEKNPLRILDCKNENCKKICASSPKIIDFLCDDCKNHFESVKSLLSAIGIEYTVNPDIVRGLDYYTRTVFEFVSGSIGSQSTVCGGGRYDSLLSQFGGKNEPAIGFATGIERLLLLLENTDSLNAKEDTVKVYVAPVSGNEYKEAFSIVNNLRAEGIIADTDHMGRSLKAQFKYADKIKAEFVAVLGEEEVKNQTVNLKNMKTGESKTVRISEIKDEIN